MLNISKTVFPMLVIHQWVENHLADVLFLEFYIHSKYIINHCIENEFNAFLSKIIIDFF